MHSKPRREPERSPPAAREQAARRTIAVTATLLVAGLVVWWFAETWIDDAMISLSYARSLGEGRGFSLVDGVQHYGFTSPLNVLLLAGVGLVTGFDHAIAVLSVLELGALVWAARRLSTTLFGRPGPGLGLALLLGASPLMLSTLGMESLLGVVLAVVALDLLARRRWRGAGLALGGLVLVRPDLGALWVGAMVLFPVTLRPGGSPDELASLRHRERRSILRDLALCGAAPPLLWHGFAWWWFGTALPVTLFIKRGKLPWGNRTFVDGPLVYLQTMPTAWLLSCLGLGLLVLPLALRRRHPGPARAFGLRVLALAVLHYVAFATLSVPPYHWYYVPSLTLAILAGWALWTGAAESAQRRLAATAVPLFLGLVGPAALLATTAGRPAEAPIHTNWATHAAYREIGAWLGRHHPSAAPIGLRGEIGTLAYFSRRDLADGFSHPRWMIDNDVLVGGGLLHRLNFARFDGTRGPDPELCLWGDIIATAPADRVLRTWILEAGWTRPVSLSLFRCGAASDDGADADSGGGLVGDIVGGPEDGTEDGAGDAAEDGAP